MKILMIDIGGTNVKVKLTGEADPRKFRSGNTLTPERFVKGVRRITQGWEYDGISVGYPGVIVDGRIAREGFNLGEGWRGFHFGKEFGCPVKLINDAALQALANYNSGRMLFLTLGTSLGSTLVADDIVVPLELGGLRLTKREAMGARVGRDGLARLGRKAWEKSVWESVDLLRSAFCPTKIRLGGGNAQLLRNIPEDCAIRTNRHALRGALRLWPGIADFHAEPDGSIWRIVRPKPKPEEATMRVGAEPN